MAQVILIERNKTINDLITINLRSQLGVELIQKNNAQEAIGLLEILPNIDLIITYHTVLSEHTAEMLRKFISDNNLTTRLIVMGSQKKDNEVDGIALYIDDSKDWKQVVQASAKILGINQEEVAKKPLPDYLPIPVRYFLNLEYTNCDVYIRIKKTAVDFQYIKRIHSGDNFTKEEILKYVSQNLAYFYIPKEGHKNFNTLLSNQLVSKLDDPTLDPTSKMQLLGESYEIAIKEIKNLGFSTDTIQLSESIVGNMVNNFEQVKEMAGFLKKILNSQTGLLFQRGHLTSIIACEMAKNMAVTEIKVFEKISYGAFFNDVAFVDDELLSKINSLDELEKANLSEAQFHLVMNHAAETAEMVKKHPEVPVGTDEIIRHHHGVQHGVGFSNQLDKLPLSSKIFVVAHNFSLELIRFKELGGNPSPIITELSKRYTGKDMPAIIASLDKAISKK